MTVSNDPTVVLSRKRHISSAHSSPSTPFLPHSSSTHEGKYGRYDQLPLSFVLDELKQSLPTNEVIASTLQSHLLQKLQQQHISQHGVQSHVSDAASTPGNEVKLTKGGMSFWVSLDEISEHQETHMMEMD